MLDLNKIRGHETINIHIPKDSPFLPEVIKSGKPVAIYYEPSYHEGINNYIRDHYKIIYILLCSNSNGMEFIYFPIFLEHLDEYIRYFFPDSTGVDTSSLTATDFYKAIAENIAELPSTGRPMLLITNYSEDRCEMPDDNSVHLQVYDLDYDDDNQFNRSWLDYLSLESLDDDLMNRFFCVHDDEADIPLWVYEKEALYGYDADKASNDILFKEIQNRVELLTANGVNRSLIMQLLFPKEPQLSKLVITDDFHIMLTDYGNREIKMPKLSKALYFLYLRHKEGLLFKELRDHKDELYDLYRTVSPREDMKAMEQSIERLVDSTNNSINVNCSRIKIAFLREFDDSMACQYYIEGPAGRVKLITLDRSLVEDRSGMIM